MTSRKSKPRREFEDSYKGFRSNLQQIKKEVKNKKHLLSSDQENPKKATQKFPKIERIDDVLSFDYQKRKTKQKLFMGFLRSGRFEEELIKGM